MAGYACHVRDSVLLEDAGDHLPTVEPWHVNVLSTNDECRTAGDAASAARHGPPERELTTIVVLTTLPE
jgi:hypothetical protein